MSKFLRGVDFPYEGFVQQALEEHFSALDYSILKEGYIDLVCVSKQGDEKWAIEAKGKTTAVGLDFRTGLGQLVQRMRERGVNYALAMPDIPQFVTQTKQLVPWLREALNLHLIFIDEAGHLRFICPTDSN